MKYLASVKENVNINFTGEQNRIVVHQKNLPCILLEKKKKKLKKESKVRSFTSGSTLVKEAMPKYLSFEEPITSLSSIGLLVNKSATADKTAKASLWDALGARSFTRELYTVGFERWHSTSCGDIHCVSV